MRTGIPTSDVKIDALTGLAREAAANSGNVTDAKKQMELCGTDFFSEPGFVLFALEPLEKGLVGSLLRYPYEVRSEEEYFDEIQDVKVTKDMLDLAKHIVNQKSGRFEPENSSAFAPMGSTHFSIIRPALFTMPFFGRSMWERGLLSAGPPHMRAGIPGTRDRGRSGISS
jgi:hypothetical protein